MINYIIEKASINNLDEIIKLQINNNNIILSPTSIKNDLKNNELYLLIKNNNKLIGYAATNNCYDHLDLISILIDKKFRNNNLATSLLIYLKDYIRKSNKNIESIFLEVRENNLNAIKLYEKNNFIFLNKRYNYYKSPVENALIYKSKI